MQKVLIITYYWPPCAGAGVKRWLKLSGYLAEDNTEVHILTVNPEKASYAITENKSIELHNNIHVHYSNTFELFNLYKKISGSKEIPYAGFANEKKPSLIQKISRFVRGNFFIPDPRKGWNRYAYKEAVSIINRFGIKHVITTSPPHSTQLIGLKLKAKLDIKWIADLRDPWTDLFYINDFYPTKIAKKINSNQERKVLEKADNVFTVSPSLKELFATKSSCINPDKIVTISNGFDAADFANINAEKSNNRFVITHSGSLSTQQSTNTFFAAIRELIDNNIDISVRLIGRIPEHVENDIKQYSVEDYIERIGYVKHEKALELMSASDAFLLIIANSDNNKGLLSAKYFEYIALKKPILAIGPVDGDLAKIIAETDTGVMMDYNDNSGIKSTLQEWIKNNPADTPEWRDNNKYSQFDIKEIAKKVKLYLN
jgi:glycosyltransferase involved in cell wall biosynthesis